MGHGKEATRLLDDDANETDELVLTVQERKAPAPAPAPAPGPPPPVTWSSLPRKGQLSILFAARFVDFLQVASLQAYVFYQLKAMDASASAGGAPSSDAVLSTQAGLLQACFTGAQVLTAMLWGKAADAPWCGRKPVLFLGLFGTAISCLGYGFSTTFFWAAFWRVVGGGVNGTVGIIRTMISEIIRDKKYQSRAFLILPMSFNLANMLGPVMGGFLADPARALPALFGAGAVLDCRWIRAYPYALPSVINAVALSLSALVVVLFLDETSPEVLRKSHGPHQRGGLARTFHLGRLWGLLQRIVLRRRPAPAYTRVPADELEAVPMETIEAKAPAAAAAAPAPAPALAPARRLPFSRLWTRNVVLTLLTTALYDFHLGAFANVWALFLSTPRGDGPALAHGLGMPASRVGVASSLLGVLGMLLQLTLYPPISAKLGVLRSFRWFLIGFPLAYFCAPLLSFSSGAVLWAGIVFVLLLQVTARTFTLPASIILLNNCSPHPSVLGTIHGLGQSTSAAFRTIGPVVGGWWYGAGLQAGAVEAGWWGVAAMAVVGCVAALYIYEGSGHEVELEDE